MATTEVTLTPHTGVMHELNESGDTRIMWNAGNQDEVEAARAHFNTMKRKGFTAYRATGPKGDKGEIIRDFDENAERIIMVPQMVGG